MRSRAIEGRSGVALIFASSLVLIVIAAIALGVSLAFEDGLRWPFVAVVASVGGLLLLGLGVVRRPEEPPSAD